jgi:DHA1 family tetracycline resistance protein-like MFS transporter
MNSTLTRLVSPDQQGELQGGVASLQSLAAVLAPPVLTGAFERCTRPGAQPYLPGAPYFVAAGLTVLSALTVAVFARGVFRRSADAAAASKAAAAAAPAAH